MTINNLCIKKTIAFTLKKTQQLLILLFEIPEGTHG